MAVFDVTVVVDCGREKMFFYRPSSGLKVLDEVFISQASAQQRSGRAGRVQRGTCYRLYTSNMFDAMDRHAKPEITRSPLVITAL